MNLPATRIKLLMILKNLPITKMKKPKTKAKRGKKTTTSERAQEKGSYQKIDQKSNFAGRGRKTEEKSI